MKPMLIGTLHNARYGATELSKYYQRSMSRSLLMSILLQVALVLSFHAVQESDNTRESPYIGIFPPPINQIPVDLISKGNSPRTPHVNVRGPLGLTTATPVPVPDDQVDSSRTVASRFQPTGGIGQEGDFEGFEPGSGDGVGTGEDNIEPPVFRPVEKPPEIVKRVTAQYPEIAVRAGIEGTVILNVWVDKTGKVRKAVVLKSSADIFNAAAVDAGMQWVFTPAYMQQGPVSVWVSIPFRFRLQTKEP